MSSIARYPVKSCRGDELAEAAVEPWGLAGDRRWMLVDSAGRFVTAREQPRLVLAHPQITRDGLTVTAPGAQPLEVRAPPARRQIDVSVWKSQLTAAWAGPDADTWFSRLLGRDVRLVYLDDPSRRSVDPLFGAPADRVSFADGYPLLVTTESSLGALNAEIADRGIGPEASMVRFRPNLVVTGTEPWAEDDWRRVRIGDVEFRAVKGCARCVLTTVDPETAEKGKEPIASLSRLRRFDGAVWFGTNLVPNLAASQRPVIRVGDPVEILAAVAPGSGPLRATA